MTLHFNYCPSVSEVDSMVVSWWIVIFFLCRVTGYFLYFLEHLLILRWCMWPSGQGDRIKIKISGGQYWPGLQRRTMHSKFDPIWTHDLWIINRTYHTLNHSSKLVNPQGPVLYIDVFGKLIFYAPLAHSTVMGTWWKLCTCVVIQLCSLFSS